MSDQIVNIEVENIVQEVIIEVIHSPVQEISIFISAVSADELAGAGKGWGAKTSAIDGGNLWDESLTDDYRFTCVKTGEPGHAIWKKEVLFNT
jgi:hypothetical protein